MSIIEVKNLIKEYRRTVSEPGLKGALKTLLYPRYETIRAVDGVSFEVEPGEMVGYIGPNGSGKSTTIKMLCGILMPTGGSIIVDGLVPYKNRIKNNFKIGVVFGQRSALFWDVPVLESFRLLQKMYEIEDKRYNANLAMLSETLDLAELLHVPERQLSLGQKMRCNLAAAFLHDPKVVFLDEPTIGVDFQSKLRIRQMIKRLNYEVGTTFIITSHDFSDIEELSRRVILIDRGRVVIDSPVDEIRKTFGRTKTIHFELASGGERAGEIFTNEGIKVDAVSESSLDATYETAEMTSMEVISMLSDKTEVLDISIKEPSIESIVGELIQK
jgi:ABC-2 type transport system ATP-binding protein